MQHLVRKYPLVIIILLWLIFVVLPIGNRGLWAPDEPRYLQVAWEMAQEKSFLVPIMNGEIYAEKPPLYFWLTILVAKILPFEIASRWVSAIASLGIVLLVYHLGKLSGNKKIGFTAALILMTCGLFSLLMYTGNIDTTLNFFTILSLCFYVKWDAEKKAKFLILAYAACGVGILAKGPVALAVPWIAYAAWEIRKIFKREAASLLHLLWGPLLALAITSIWLIPACISGGAEYTQTIIFKQQVDRTIKSVHKARAWWDYLVNFPYNSLPWFIVLIGALTSLKNHIKEKNPPLLLFMLWFCTTFIFFSLMSGKRERYILHCYPVFSLVLAHVIAKWDEQSKASRSIQGSGILTLIGAVIIMLFPLGLPFLKDKFPALHIFPVSISDWRLWAVFAIGIPATWILYRALKLAQKKHHLMACNLIALGFLLIAAIAQTYYIPYIDSVKSARRASEKIMQILPPDGTMAFYWRRFDNGWNFYLKRAKIPVIRNEDIMQNPPRYDVIILRKKHLELLKSTTTLEHYEIADTVPVGGSRFLLLKLKP